MTFASLPLESRKNTLLKRRGACISLEEVFNILSSDNWRSEGSYFMDQFRYQRWRCSIWNVYIMEKFIPWKKDTGLTSYYLEMNLMAIFSFIKLIVWHFFHFFMKHALSTRRWTSCQQLVGFCCSGKIPLCFPARRTISLDFRHQAESPPQFGLRTLFQNSEEIFTEIRYLAALIFYYSLFYEAGDIWSGFTTIHDSNIFLGTL